MTHPASPAPPARTWRGGVVAADHPAASEAGRDMLARGGNAVDAAVATSFCLSVVRPYSCGIGGGGFMLILRGEPRVGAGEAQAGPEQGGRATALDYRERAPAGVDPYHFERLGDSLASRFTGHAVGVPGTVAGLLHVLEQYGSLDRETVLAPAIRAAEKGFAVDRHYLENAAEVERWFAEDPARASRHRFLWERFLAAGQVAEGDRITNPEQADALRLIAAGGARAFYDGPIARAIIEAVAGAGGVMTADDLRSYAPAPARPLAGSFHGDRLLAMPPPSSGGVAILQVLGVLESLERERGIVLEKLGHNRPTYVHLVTEALKHAFADRSRWFGDPDFADVPIDRLLDRPTLDRLAARIDGQRTQPAADYGSFPPLGDDGGTSHFCVIDARGNAVSCTETINLEFGSRIAVERYGFFLNNEMDDFTTVRGQPNAFNLQQSDRNLPAPGKRPLSSMSPVIVLDDAGRVKLMAGGSGGPRIISAVVQVLLNALVFDLPAAEAVASPRFHHQWWPEVLGLEAGPRGTPGPLAALADDLRARGHQVEASDKMGAVQLILRGGEGYQAASDPRKGGRPAGR